VYFVSVFHFYPFTTEELMCVTLASNCKCIVLCVLNTRWFCFLKISCSYFLTNTMEQSPSRETLLGSPRIYGSRIFITKSQRCASWSYSVPDESSSCPVLLKPILISSYKRQVLPSGLLFWSFATKSCMHISSPSSTIPDTLPIPSFLIWWCE